MRLRVLAALGAVAMLLCGCASVTRGTTEPVVFESEPSGAEMHSVVDYPCGGPCPVREDKVGSATAYEGDKVQTPPVPGPACVTPCTVQVARNQDLVVTFTKAGYRPKTVKLGREVTGNGGLGLAGNIIAGGAVGLVTDGITGAATDHKPNPLHVVLEPLAPAAPAKRAAKPKRG